MTAVHGLAGTPEDLSYLKESLDRRGGPEILVHLARCNQGKTKDGVAMGGERLANEVRVRAEGRGGEGRPPSLPTEGRPRWVVANLGSVGLLVGRVCIT